VRCGAISLSSHDIWVTGSYDHTVKVWDMRLQKEVISITVHNNENDHLLSPVESLVLYPSGSMLAVGAGNEVKIFDLATGGRLLHTMSNHVKTVTCVDIDKTGTRLLSGSLDHMLKVYDTRDFATIHSFNYPAPVLSFALAVSTHHHTPHTYSTQHGMYTSHT
jgi:U3 small nucleolar RNA-associated protein 15